NGVNGTLVLSSLALVAGGLLLTYHALAKRRPSLSVRLARIDSRGSAGSTIAANPPLLALPYWLTGIGAYYARELRHAGGRTSLRLLLAHKALLALAAPFVVLAPYAAATARLPSLGFVLLLAAAGSLIPDVLLRQEVKRRREAIFLDLPEALSVLALALGTG